MIYKLQNGGVIKLQKAWTKMPSVEDAILRAWSNQSAKEKAEKQVASEKPKYTYVNPYDYLHGWREATEDAAKQDKYTVENLGGSKEEAEAAYNAAKENAAKQLAGTTVTGLGTVALLGLSGGAAGPVAADIVNTGFGAHGLYNALSGNVPLRLPVSHAHHPSPSDRSEPPATDTEWYAVSSIPSPPDSSPSDSCTLYPWWW